MITIVLAACPESLRGHLTRWLTEVAPGTFVGKVNSRIRDKLWELVVEECKSGRAIMTFTSRQLDTSGQTWHNRLRQHDADLQGLDLNRLHTLYARLSELRRPDRQQIGQTLNIKALLLETCDKRNP